MTNEEMLNELNRIKEHYNKRVLISNDKYNILQPDVYLRKQEFELVLIKWLKWVNFGTFSDKKLLEIGCGTGLNLLKFVELGFNPKNIIGNELLHDRALDAKKNVPKEIKILEGNALDLDLPNDFFDIVFQSTVFSSILNINFRKELSLKLWQLVKPGGGILWYDFTYNNPSNKDVSGIKLKVLKQLFPEGKMKFWRLTLAPPIGRLVVKIHPSLYTFFNIFPFLKTHVLCWIEKKRVANE